MHIHVEIVARVASVLPKEAFGVGLVNCLLELVNFIPEFAAHINVGCFGPHRKANNKSSFDKLVRIVAHYFPVFTSAGLRFVGVYYQVRRPSIRNLRHERVLETRRESGTASPAQPTLFDLINQPVVTHADDVLCAVPVAALHCSVDEAITVIIDVCKNAVLVR